MSLELLKKTEDHQKLLSFDWMDWFVQNQKRCLAIALGLFVALGVGAWWMAKNRAQEAKDLEMASQLALELENNGDSLAELIALENRYATLQGRYDGIISEELILQKKKDEIDPYASRTVRQLESLGLTNFAKFSDISRLASQQKFEEALAAANELHASLSSGAFPTLKQEKRDNEYALHAFTLFEIASLNKALGRTDDMHQALGELSTLLGLNTQFSLDSRERVQAAQLFTLLQERQSSLLDYLRV